MSLNTSHITTVLVAAVAVAFVEAVVKPTAMRRILATTVILIAVVSVAIQFQQ